MKIRILIIVLAMLPLCLSAQRRSQDTFTPAPDEQEVQASEPEYSSSQNNSTTSEPEYTSARKSSKKSKDSGSKGKDKEGTKVFSGFTGGMMIHGGYAFSRNPAEMFRNGSLTENGSTLTDLPKDGFTMGLGGTLRLHLIDHIHLGGEGHMSFMPLTASGTSIRTGWGGVMCDFYADLGIFRPIIGMTVGGGSTRRLFVPDDSEQTVTGDNKMVYNASFTKTPFFLLDPYVGFEIALGKVALLVRVDYMLPFGKSDKGLLAQDVSWSNFMSPSGPRLYIGCMFGKFK